MMRDITIFGLGVCSALASWHVIWTRDPLGVGLAGVGALMALGLLLWPAKGRGV
jgi:hypothetical protein